jgi:hypothetical protein
MSEQTEEGMQAVPISGYPRYDMPQVAIVQSHWPADLSTAVEGEARVVAGRWQVSVELYRLDSSAQDHPLAAEQVA